MYSKEISLKLIGKIMSKLKIFLASINANKLIEELKKDPATLNINDEVLPNHLADLIEILKGDDTVKTLTMCIRVQFIIT
ncbi:hypothetical protein KNCP2_09270 [Candidatus Rickettsia kedanie]|uniref:Uncharacterized protein n=2 Tax=Candidatus Rickettsia kedanie TaxID=3115352 RepID=A0ABP9TTS1_9RICK